MIEEKRLEELIKNKGVVWVYSTYSKPYRILPITFDGKREINSHTFCLNWNVKNIFETKEEAEWQLEFGNITRTETLNLPTWEEFQKDGEFSFLDKQGFEWDLYSPDDETRISLVGGYDHYEFDYTKENYTLACRKAKELFLGEKEDENEENKD